jgi:hypothetical protein
MRKKSAYSICNEMQFFDNNFFKYLNDELSKYEKMISCTIMDYFDFIVNVDIHVNYIEIEIPYYCSCRFYIDIVDDITYDFNISEKNKQLYFFIEKYTDFKTFDLKLTENKKEILERFRTYHHMSNNLDTIENTYLDYYQDMLTICTEEQLIRQIKIDFINLDLLNLESE